MKRDKVLHVLAGILLGLTAFVLPFWLAAVLLVAVAAGKELVWDLAMKRGTPDLLDAVATIAGGLPLLLVGYYLQ